MVPQPWEFEGVVRFTRIGAAYIIGTVVLAVAAVNTGNNALYIAVAFTLGCLLLSGMASKGGLKHLEVRFGGLPEAWAGRDAVGMLTVHNGSRIWNVRDIVLTSPAFAAPIVIPQIRRKSEVTLEARFLFERRGLAHVASIDSYTRYPFGFVLKKRRLKVGSEVVVFPRLLEGDVTAGRFRLSKGEETGSNRVGPGSEIHSFREYVRGDSLRHVHWKKSASFGRWIMKQQEGEATRTVEVVVDPWKPHGVSDERFEEMVSAAATFIHDAVTRGFDVKLMLPRLSVRSRRGEPAAGLFRALALLEPIFEPVHQAIDRHAVVFSVAGESHDAKSA